VQGAVGPVVVVERFEFAQGVQQVGLVQDDGAVEEFGSAGSKPSATASPSNPQPDRS
jgi:hypothetical protein